MDATWCRGRPNPQATLLDEDPAPPPTKKRHSPFQFWAMSVVAKQLDQDATALGTEVGLGPDHIVLD